MALPACIKNRSGLWCCVGLLCATAIALLTFALIFSFWRANPVNTSWIGKDYLVAHLGWANYRLETEPAYMLRTSALSTPISVNIALFDAVPIVALGLKLISAILPEPMQYIGGFVLVGAVLQGVFGFLLFHDTARRYHQEPTATLFSVVASIFIVASPIAVWRWQGHVSLSWQWPLIAAFWLYLRSGVTSHARILLGFTLLFALMGGVNVYISLMLGFIYCGLLLHWALEGSLTIKRMAAGLLPPLAGIASLSAFGYFSFALGGLRRGWGYGFYSANLFSLIDPQHLPATFLPQLSNVPGQYEGYGYLGLGAIAMIALGVVVAARRGKLASPHLIPMSVVAVAAFILALSTTFKAGQTTLFTVPLPQYLYAAVSTFRASGRFIWIPHYLIVIAGAILLAKSFKSSTLVPVIAGLAILQIVDLAPTWAAFRTALDEMKTPSFSSPVWRELGHNHRSLLALPPWQCDQRQTPGGPAGYWPIGALALKEGLVTNNFYFARAPRDVWETHCERFALHFEAQPIQLDAAYAMNKQVFFERALRLIETHRCQLADGIVLCTNDPPGLSEDLAAWIGHRTIGANTVLTRWSEKLRHGLVSGWNVDDEGRIWMSDAAARLQFKSLFPSSRSIGVTLALRDAREDHKNPETFDVYIGALYAGTITVGTSPTAKTFGVPAGLIRLGETLDISLLRRGPSAGEPVKSRSIELVELSFVTVEDSNPITTADFFFSKHINGRHLLKQGWSYLEDWGVWSDGDRAILRLPILDDARRLMFDAKIVVFADKRFGKDHQTIEAYIDGKLIDTLRLGSSTSSLSLQLETDAFSGEDDLEIEFRFPDAGSPVGTGDTRRLALGLRSIRLESLH